MLAAFLAGLIIAGILAVYTIIVLTVLWIIEKVEERLAANKRHKVVFADMTEVVDSYVKIQKKEKKEYSMDELERMCQDAAYVMADYDIDTGEYVDFTGINAESVEQEVKNKLKEEEGIITFDS